MIPGMPADLAARIEADVLEWAMDGFIGEIGMGARSEAYLQAYVEKRWECTCAVRSTGSTIWFTPKLAHAPAWSTVCPD